MTIYECEVCGHRIEETAFDECTDDWTCPVCESDKSYFRCQEG